jgi:probable phosphoglycerate mutase
MEIIDEGLSLTDPGLRDGGASFFLARHGQTEWNTSGRRQGQMDSPLSSEGVAQAHKMAELLSDYSIDGVFTSPLGRALTTATICATRLQVPVVTVPSLTEIDHGSWAGLTDAEIEKRYPEEYACRNADKFRFQFPGGESYADADPRAAAALAVIGGHRVSRPLVVSHEMIGRLLRRHLLHLTPEDALRWNHPHGRIFRIST